MHARLADKVALITGAGSGIGRATAHLFAAEQAAVAVVDLDLDAAMTVVAEIEDAGGRALALGADVANAASITAAVDATVAAFGHLDVVYNNAGVDARGSVEETEEADWDRCFAVNAKGTYLTSRAAVPHLVAAGGGSIINQASVAALVGIPRFAAYCAAKGAVAALTRAMAVDLSPQGIRVNAIAPGTVFTPLMEPMLRARGDGDLEVGLARTVVKYPIGRLGTPEEIAAVALFLASDEAGFVTGAVLNADGGMTAQ